MKKSEKYTKAMLAVVNSFGMKGEDKLEIIEQLLDDRKVAEYVEKEYKDAKLQ